MAKTKSFLENVIKLSDNEYASIVEDGITGGDIDSYLDTGSYMLNAQLSGSIYKGMPANKRLALAGEESVGKTFYTLAIIAKALAEDPNTQVVYFESETALTKEMLVQRGIDVSRVAILPVTTVEEFRTQALRTVNAVLEIPVDERPKVIVVLDSLGNLSTNKEMEDTEKANDKRDMTKAPLIKGAFRVLTLRSGLANIAMIVTNHVYNVIGSYIPTKEMGGGGGLKYAADQILFLSKKKATGETLAIKDDKAQIGNIITSVMNKSRFTREKTKVQTLLTFDHGLDRHYGLLDFGQEVGLIEKVAAGRSFEYKMPDGQQYSEKHIYANPEQVWTKKNLDAIDEACQKEFLYGSTAFTVVEEEAAK